MRTIVLVLVPLELLYTRKAYTHAKESSTFTQTHVAVYWSYSTSVFQFDRQISVPDIYIARINCIGHQITKKTNKVTAALIKFNVPLYRMFLLRHDQGRSFKFTSRSFIHREKLRVSLYTFLKVIVRPVRIRKKKDARPNVQPCCQLRMLLQHQVKVNVASVPKVECITFEQTFLIATTHQSSPVKGQQKCPKYVPK